jgi:hypothetical protein
MGETGGGEMSGYTGKRLAEEWFGERDVDDEGGPVAVQYERCPHCGSTAVRQEQRDVDLWCYVCDDCEAESQPL